MKIKNISREEEELSRAIDVLIKSEPTVPDPTARAQALFDALYPPEINITAQAIDADQTNLNI